MIQVKVVSEGRVDFDEIGQKTLDDIAAELRLVRCDVHGEEVGDILMKMGPQDLTVDTTAACCEAFAEKLVVAFENLA